MDADIGKLNAASARLQKAIVVPRTLCAWQTTVPRTPQVLRCASDADIGGFMVLWLARMDRWSLHPRAFC